MIQSTQSFEYFHLRFQLSEITQLFSYSEITQLFRITYPLVFTCYLALTLIPIYIWAVLEHHSLVHIYAFGHSFEVRQKIQIYS